MRYRPGKTLRCFPSFSLAAAHKVKVKGKVEAFLKKSFTKKLYARYRSAPGAHVRYPLDEHERQRAAIGAN